jgi:hypothetical protein
LFEAAVLALVLWRLPGFYQTAKQGALRIDDSRRKPFVIQGLGGLWQTPRDLSFSRISRRKAKRIVFPATVDFETMVSCVGGSSVWGSR